MESEGKTRKPTGTRYSDEVRERAIRMVFEHQPEYQTQGAAIRSIASKMGMSRETLRGGAVGSDSQIEFISGSAWVIKLPI